MDAFSSAELSALQSAQEAAMQDTCTIGGYSETFNDYGQAVGVWTEGDAQLCGLDMRGGREVHDAQNALVVTDATLRLPVSTEVDMRDRITVTHRYGVAITAIVYEIVSPVRRGPSGVQLDLRRLSL